MKHKIHYKILGVILAFVLLFNCIPIAVTAAETLPAVYDPRKTSPIMVTPVKNQPDETCWSYGAIASLESYMLKRTSKQQIYSENYLNYILATNAFSDGSNPHAYNRTLGGTGNAVLAANAFANWNGPVLDSQFPKSITGPVPRDRLKSLEQQLHVQSYNYFAPLTGPMGEGVNEANRAKKVNNIKSAVYNNGAATYNVNISSTYFNSANSAQYRPVNQSAASNHVVTVVGWDDNYPVSKFNTTPPGPGAFIVKNSYGTGWGDGGYYYSSYYDYYLYESSVVSFSEVESADNYYKNYSHTEIMAVEAQQIPAAATNPVYFANVFSRDITSNEYIDAVGFFTVRNNTPYEIYVNPNSESLDPSSLKLVKKGTIPLSGYTTIPLDTEQYIGASAKKFAVAVKMTVGTSMVPVEAKRHSPSVVVNSGESFYSTSGSSWTDNVSNGNFILRAYTNNDNASTSYSVTVSAGTGGSAHGSGNFSAGSSVTVSAIPNAGYNFDGWYENGNKIAGAGATYSFTASSNRVLEARFKPNTTSISITVSAGTGGSAQGSGNYTSGSSVTVSAIPNSGYSFDGWYENGNKIAGAGASYSFTANSDRVLEARFNPIPFSITVSAGAGGSAHGSGSYTAGSNVTISAIPNAGYNFDGWYENGNKIAGAGATYYFIASSNRVLEARFSAIDIPDFEITEINISGNARAGAPLNFTVQTQGGASQIKYAYYVTGNGKVHHKVVYSDLNSFTYTPDEAGTYSVRAYAIDAAGEKVVLAETFTVQ